MSDMTRNGCTYPGNRDEAIVAYVYGEIGDAERASFAAHVASCLVCRHEIDELGGVRAQLARWSPPDLEPVVSWVPPFGKTSGDRAEQATLADRAPHWWQAVPVWAQTAAALLFLGVAAGAANLNVHYDQGGLSITTGWMRSAASAPAQDASWRADLTALRQQLRDEMQATAAASADAIKAVKAAPAPAVNEGQILRRVKAMVDDSAKSQQSELALRIAQLSREVQRQRIADLTAIDYKFGFVQTNTGMQVQQQNQMINALAVRASQTK
jgi:hypothetical protein